MKYLLVLFVVVLAAWLLFGRRGAKAPGRPRSPETKGAQSMLACAHCGVHLPEADTTRDGDGRAFCSEAHRLAGPR